MEVGNCARESVPSSVRWDWIQPRGAWALPSYPKSWDCWARWPTMKGVVGACFISAGVCIRSRMSEMLPVLPKFGVSTLLGYQSAVSRVVSAARRTKSTMNTGAFVVPGTSVKGWLLLSVSALFRVTSSALPVASLNSGSVGTEPPRAVHEPLM